MEADSAACSFPSGSRPRVLYPGTIQITPVGCFIRNANGGACRELKVSPPREGSPWWLGFSNDGKGECGVAEDAGVLDVLVIGAGQAAVPLVFGLAKTGRQVALAERKRLGGSCVNFGCTPTKAVIASARLAHQARRASEFGVWIPTVTVDFPAVLEAARAIVRESRDGLEEDLANAGGNPALLRGHARFVGRDARGFQVRIGDAGTVTAKEVVIDTGTRALVPDVPGLDGVPCITADDWLDHPDLPEHLVLLGGGYIGLEMGQFYRRMGSRVTVVERGPRLMEREEPEAAEALQRYLEGEGISFLLGAEATGIERAGAGGISLMVRQGNVTRTVAGSHLFVATGRKPNTDDLGLDAIGLKPAEQGFLSVDERLAMPVAGVWAAGDVRGGPMFTHTSWDDYRILMSQLTGDASRTTRRNVPYAVFTDPELARLGQSEAEARRDHTRVKVGRFEMQHNGHAREFREKKGFIKVIVDAETDRVLGVTALCEAASELIHLYEMLINADAPYTVLRDAVIAHPTLSEGAQSATESVRET
jgi:pyruvate/2-oxoglutarate dehydrogenase complex dihydrolipoamide dehydrogenase (E3) component